MNNNMNNNMNNGNNGFNDIIEKIKILINDVVDSSNYFSREEIETDKWLSILSYIGPLSLVSYFYEKENRYAIYHSRQGLNLFLIELIVWVAVGIVGYILGWRLAFITRILGGLSTLIFFALSIVGIVDVLNGRAKELPIINKFKIIRK